MASIALGVREYNWHGEDGLVVAGFICADLNIITKFEKEIYSYLGYLG